MSLTVISSRDMMKILSAPADAPAARVATASHASQGESPAFMSAVHDLSAAVARFDDTLHAKTAALAFFETIAPRVPSEIRCINSHLSEQGLRSPFRIAEPLQNGDLQEVWSEDNRPLYVLVSWKLKKHVSRSDGRTAKGKDDRRLLRVVQAYEVELGSARMTANLEAVREAHFWADDAVRKAAMALAELDATTMRGALLKAQGWIAAGSRQEDIRFDPWARRVILDNIATVLASAA